MPTLMIVLMIVLAFVQIPTSIHVNAHPVDANTNAAPLATSM
eukprot:CAMPEP_0198121858 /NCGR_PEP_ID=MMETSP1442-20131203/33249_1 /TAXON_ID= /ORGANISM="Craspedostauros australis, Strain CCMP3328" /LENGTH=41 /DNA_ID= /DNA_START= /DNA_END= /DNA_ORIENTATION=